MIEKVTRDAMHDVDHTLQRYSGCEDTGVPEPIVIVDVPGWSRAGNVREHLLGLGWAEEDRRTWTGPDRSYQARLVWMTDGGDRHSLIYFSVR